MIDSGESFPLEEFERWPVHPPESVLVLGRVVVVAPHPDDESLGCGGLLALLGRYGIPAWVLVVTDGTGSHPDSPSYPRPHLRSLREAETRTALAHLGQPGRSSFLGLPDGEIPVAGTEGFDGAVGLVRGALRRLLPDPIVLPWRRDPHGDHRSSWLLVRAAVDAEQAPVRRWLEYPVWLWTRGGRDAAPRSGEATPWRLDITSVLERKRSAIDAHRSQTRDLITDSPSGFRLSEAERAPFERPWELFLDPTS